jgi:hypothetical protein
MTEKVWLDEADIDLAAFEALLDAGREAPKPAFAGVERLAEVLPGRAGTVCALLRQRGTGRGV